MFSGDVLCLGTYPMRGMTEWQLPDGQLAQVKDKAARSYVFQNLLLSWNSDATTVFSFANFPCHLDPALYPILLYRNLVYIDKNVKSFKISTL